MKLIDKDALVAEIEKCYNECRKRTKIIDSDYWNAKADAYRNVLAILNDTIEVKETDAFIEKAVKYLKDNVTYIHPRKGTEECIVNIPKFVEYMKGRNE